MLIIHYERLFLQQTIKSIMLMLIHYERILLQQKKPNALPLLMVMIRAGGGQRL